MSDMLLVCNGALQKIGVPRIMSLSEGSKEAGICNSEFYKCFQTLLRLYPWGFASARTILSPDPVPPAFEFAFKLHLPADYMRVIEIYEYCGRYRVEGKYMLADSDTIKLRYVSNNVTIADADSLFSEALEWWLGYTIARYLTESDTVRQECMAGFKQIMPIAKFVQSTENSQPEVESYDLIESRFGGSRFPRDPMT